MKIFNCRKYLAKFSKSDIIQLILAKDNSLWVRRNLAENINISEDIQLILIDGLGSIYNNFLIKEYLAKNTRICKEVQLKLCGDTRAIKILLASNLGVCKEVQILLARESSRHVKSTLSKNKNLSQEANLILSKDKPI